MCTLNACLDSIQTHIGFPRSRSAGVAPELDQRDVCTLLSTLMSVLKLYEAVDHARAYAAMFPGGAVLTADAPDSIPRSALEYLEVKSEIAIGGQPDAVADVRGIRLEYARHVKAMVEL